MRYLANNQCRVALLDGCSCHNSLGNDNLYMVCILTNFDIVWMMADEILEKWTFTMRIYLYPFIMAASIGPKLSILRAVWCVVRCKGSDNWREIYHGISILGFSRLILSLVGLDHIILHPKNHSSPSSSSSFCLKQYERTYSLSVTEAGYTWISSSSRSTGFFFFPYFSYSSGIFKGFAACEVCVLLSVLVLSDLCHQLINCKI